METNTPKRSARKEVYGFVGWMASWVGLFTYLGWTFLPDSVLHPLGITYYPDRYWAIAVPMFLLLSWLYSIIVYLAMNLIDTAPIDSFKTITDDHANEITESEGLQEEGQIVAIADVPITVVNELLYCSKTGDDIPFLKLSSGIKRRPYSSTRSVSSIAKI